MTAPQTVIWLFAIMVGVLFWQTATAAPPVEVLKVAGTSAETKFVAFSPDGQYLAVAGTGTAFLEIRFFHVKTGEPAVTLKPKAAVLEIAFSPDGKRFGAAIGGAGGGFGGGARDIVVWELESGKELYKLEGVYHTHAWSFSPDGKQLATGNFDGTITVWDAAKGDEIVSFKLEGAKGQIEHVKFMGNGGQLAGVESNTSTVYIFDSATGNVRKNFPVGSKDIGDLVLSRDNRRMAVLAAHPQGHGYMPYICDPSTGRVLVDMYWRVESGPSNLGFSPDGKWLALRGLPQDRTSKHGPVRIWDAASGKELAQIKDRDPSFLAVSPDSSLLAGACKRDGVVVWKVAEPDAMFRTDVRTVVAGASKQAVPTTERTGSPMTAPVAAVVTKPLLLEGHTTPKENDEPRPEHKIVDLALSPDHTQLASVNAAGQLLLWNLKSGESTTLAQQGGARRVRFTLDGKTLLGGDHHHMSAWDVATKTGKSSFGEAGSASPRWHMAGDATAFAVLEYPGKGVNRYRFVQTASDKTLMTLQESAKNLAVANGGRLAAFSDKRDIRLLDLAAGRELDAIPGLPFEPDQLIFDPSGKQLAAVAYHCKQFQIWELAGASPRLATRAEVGGLSSNSVCQFTPDGKQLLFVGSKVQIWDAATNKVQQIIGLKETAIVSADGRTALGLTKDTQILVAELPSGKTRTILELTIPPGKNRHNYASGALAIASDGSFAAIGTLAGRIEVRPLVADATEIEVTTLASPIPDTVSRGETPQGGHHVGFSEDGKYVVAARRRWTAIAEIESGKFWFPLVESRNTTQGLRVNSYLFHPTKKSMVALDYAETGIWSYDIGAERPTKPLTRTQYYAFRRSPDGKMAIAVHKPPSKSAQLVLLGSEDNKVIGEPILQDLPGDDGTLHAMHFAFSTDGDRIAVAMKRTVRIWDVATRKEWQVAAEGDYGAIYLIDGGRTLVTAPGWSALTGMERPIELYDVATGQKTAPIELRRHHTGAVHTVAVSPREAVFATAGDQGEVLLRALPTGDLIRRLTGHTGPVEGLAFSPGGNLLASVALGERDQKLLTSKSLEMRIWKLDASSLSRPEPLAPKSSSPAPEPFRPALAPRELASFDVKLPAGPAMQFSPDGKVLAAGFGTAALYDVAGKQVRWTEALQARDHSQGVPYYFSSDGQWLAGRDDDSSRKVAVTDLTTGKTQKTDGTWGMSCAAFSPDGKTLLVGKSNTSDKNEHPAIVALDPKTLTVKVGIPLRGAFCDALAYAPDGSVIAAGLVQPQTRRVVLLDPQTLEIKATLVEGYNGAVNWLRFSPEGKSLALAVSSDLTRYQIWKMADRTLWRSSESRGLTDTTFMSFVGESSILIRPSGTNTLALYDLATGSQRATIDYKALHPPTGGVPMRGFALSRDGRWMVTGGTNGKAVVWDVVRAKNVATIDAHEDEILAAVLSDDGRRLATAGKDDRIKVWAIGE